MRKSNIFWGLLLIIIGSVALLGKFYNFEFISWYRLWPLFVLLPGLAFELGYFSTGRNPGLLVPGGILTTIGLLFLFETYTNWSLAGYTWPIYPLSVAIGLFQLYLFGGREKGLLVPVFILGGVSLISLANIISRRIFSLSISGFILPVALVLLGVYILLRKNDR
jgi:hypothetical protein